jgi:hypothetical protein
LVFTELQNAIDPSTSQIVFNELQNSIHQSPSLIDENTMLNLDKTNDRVDCGDMEEGRKRKKLANKNNWKRKKNCLLRMQGEEYLGFTRDRNRVFKQNVSKPARTIGQRCSSQVCEKSTKRHCGNFEEHIRIKIFTTFWKMMTWDQRKVFVSGHVTLQPPARRTQTKTIKRSTTLIYRLHNGNELVQVCKIMFMNTLGLRRSMVESWVKDSAYGISESKYLKNERRNSSNFKVTCFAESVEFLKIFFNDLPKLPSHYVRKDTNLYI